MKKVFINNKTLEYEVIFSEFDGLVTDFYYGVEDITYRKYLFFGKTIVKRVPKLVFTVYFNIEDTHRTKAEIRAILKRELEPIEREDEIKRGELI